MKIRVLRSIGSALATALKQPGAALLEGAEADVDDKFAAELAKRGLAEVVESEKPKSKKE